MTVATGDRPARPSERRGLGPRRLPVNLRGLRLASGLVLMVFVVSHFLNHALGLVSLDAAEAGRRVFAAVWNNLLGDAVLALAVATHIVLALQSLHARRTLRLTLAEAAQLGLGILIPVLLMPHVIGASVAPKLHDIEATYARVLLAIWVADPVASGQQTVALLVTWLHGAMGVHLWLRLKPWYPAAMPALLSAALLVPLLAALGFVAAARDVARLAAQPGWTEAYLAGAGALTPDDGARLSVIETWVLLTLGVALIVVLAARSIRKVLERRRGVLRITYPNGRVVRLVAGPTLLEASRQFGIPHASVCGGRGRCSTCRVRVGAGIEQLPPPDAFETRVLDRIMAAPDVRLACQIRPIADLVVTPLLPPLANPRDAHARSMAHHGQERLVAILFADLRGFTALTESKLPYDIVFILNRYFAAMGDAVSAAGGRVDKFIGDGVMALFGVDQPGATAARQALKAARNMAAEMRDLNLLLASDLREPLRVGIGIHAGPAIIGEVGYGRASSVTAIGDAVNAASRLEALTKDYGAELVVSEDVARLAAVDLSAFPKVDTSLRGRSEPLAVRVIADLRELPELRGG